MAALAAAAALGACSTPERTSQMLRFTVGDGSERAHLILEQPAGWSHEASLDTARNVALLRLSSKPPEAPPQLRLAPRVVSAPAPADRQALLAAARRELAAAGECAGAEATLQDQPVGPRAHRGLALACSRSASRGASSLTPAVAGVVLSGHLVVRFAILDHDPAAQAQAWSVLRSIEYSTTPLLP